MRFELAGRGMALTLVFLRCWRMQNSARSELGWEAEWRLLDGHSKQADVRSANAIYASSPISDVRLLPDSTRSWTSLTPPDRAKLREVNKSVDNIAE